jgi:hypothetical protein
MVVVRRTRPPKPSTRWSRGAEAGVERFVPSEFGYIYEWEQFWPTDTVHKTMSRQKAFIRRMIEMTGMDFTIIPAGLWPEYYMLEPVGVMGDGVQKFSWSTGRDVGRIIPHVLAHPASRNAICPVAATAYCSWNELLDTRERLLGGRSNATTWMLRNGRPLTRTAARSIRTLMAIGVAATECPEGMSLWAHWNARYRRSSGYPLAELFPGVIEPFVAGRGPQ